jgi:hypothetical protein
MDPNCLLTGVNDYWYPGPILTSLLLVPGAVGIATGYGLDDREVGIGVLVRSRISLLHVVQPGSEAHPTSYPMGTGGKAAGA